MKLKLIHLILEKEIIDYHLFMEFIGLFKGKGVLQRLSVLDNLKNQLKQ